MAYELLTPDTCALALINHQPQMFFGTHSHECTTLMHNIQILAKRARLLKVLTVQMLAEGFEIYVPTDACGDITEEAHERAVQRVVQAGAVPMTSVQFMCELQRDWARGETYAGVMEIFKAHTSYGIGVRYAKQILGGHAN
ncbi:isochorismatase family protein [Paraburkholderia kirstenboschensis]|uniref:Isochorismatase family protein n=1 Tax=Paraburkholderia kirstenboschensis TaxID=1245436 RepID=A0ABZ0EBG1_9BURK|nr:isochorismatase family protein [Paraburkholderia kirstenboschensis]WOD13844.1 isochorismatase family protein [Paraburkholderia kirstenboschensis]